MSTLAIFGGPKSIPDKTLTYWPAPGRRHVDAIASVIRSGKFHRVNHPSVLEFEEELERHAAASARATGSGTAAIQIALQAMTDETDTVVVPAYNWPGAVGPIATLGRSVRFVDVDPKTACVSADELSRLAPHETLVITHLFGNWPSSAEGNAGVAPNILHDCAQAFGAVADLGRRGSHIIVSGNGAKHLAAGELGAVIGPSRIIDEVERVSLASSSRNGERVFAPSTLGFNFRPNVFSAAIATQRVREFGEDLQRRRENAGYLLRRLSELDMFVPLVDVDSHEKNSYLDLSFRFRPEARSDGRLRDLLVEALIAEGVPASVWLREPVWKYMPHVQNEDLSLFPETNLILKEQFHITEIGTPNGLREMSMIADAFEKVMEGLPQIIARRSKDA
ncbi:DegT/DnrJ/EryC1/StrS family aminotransferase [Nocardiopsis dassonvillei]|uniref:DegT/DnrJ/EryC1/StrS family aminotransferase n=1 Tax=Nocardiopsis dassonvillei TaxID=2014 RepID=UPI00366CBE0A